MTRFNVRSKADVSLLSLTRIMKIKSNCNKKVEQKRKIYP